MSKQNKATYERDVRRLRADLDAIRKAIRQRTEDAKQDGGQKDEQGAEGGTGEVIET